MSSPIDIENDGGDASCCSEFQSADELSLSGEMEEEKDCRICQMGLESSRQECGVPMVLGCSCKDELGFVHKHCAETWFKIKGDKTCEICHSIVQNLYRTNEIDQTIGLGNNTEDAAGIAAATANNSEGQRFWRGHRFLNFLLACMISAFVISWFFHFKMPSQQ